MNRVNRIFGALAFCMGLLGTSFAADKLFDAVWILNTKIPDAAQELNCKRISNQLQLDRVLSDLKITNGDLPRVSWDTHSAVVVRTAKSKRQMMRFLGVSRSQTKLEIKYAHLQTRVGHTFGGDGSSVPQVLIVSFRSNDFPKGSVTCREFR